MSESGGEIDNRALSQSDIQKSIEDRKKASNNPSLKQKLAAGITATAVALGIHAANQTDAPEVATDIFASGRDAIVQPLEQIENPKQSDLILSGTVSISTGDNLNVRTTPNSREAINEIGWDKVKLVNKNGELVNFKKGDTIDIENAEIVIGGIHGDSESENKWITLITQKDNGDLGAVYVALGDTTRDYVKTSQESKYIDPKVNPNEVPENINLITVRTPDSTSNQ